MNCKIVAFKINLRLWIYVDTVPDTSYIQEYISANAPEILRQQLSRESKTYNTNPYTINKRKELFGKILSSEILLKSSCISIDQIAQLMESIQRELPGKTYMPLYLSDNHTAIFELHVLLTKIIYNQTILKQIYIINFLENLFDLNKESNAFCFTFAVKRFAEIIAQISPTLKDSINEFLNRYRANFKNRTV